VRVSRHLQGKSAGVGDAVGACEDVQCVQEVGMGAHLRPGRCTWPSSPSVAFPSPFSSLPRPRLCWSIGW
jgi:hypothetical protein